MVCGLTLNASAANNVIRTSDVNISVDGVTVEVPDGSIWISEDGYTMVGTALWQRASPASSGILPPAPLRSPV